MLDPLVKALCDEEIRYNFTKYFNGLNPSNVYAMCTKQRKLTLKINGKYYRLLVSFSLRTNVNVCSINHYSINLSEC